MANSTKKTKQSTFLNLGEKNQIFEHRENNPGDSFETIARITMMTREMMMKDLTKKTKMKTVSFSNWFNPRR